ncbi:hypothetical protein HOP50_01g02910 [Chloropicon primus]|uniref:Uncharacterized protein n=1 Tax=Chloropicon primus TaxID=1764295 RepID=A0A5B8MBQ0_9CHLO|nr:hypothetical protein A3770_01p03010 [Chloropicon primus]UPQ97000.1 hypothetical protein HOP50_01g02910 [Chloropicon primus]|mmetsp:Transcript_13663/g.38476  ORF Transcript_13663/g.38476 Transcript_13663/m.38476 type:complete len:501 (+) Transcript_13663:293-1795(+)|eukprot:QDZ17783.1 hypothetical protein A3770_01p03010 [Chloropicon primus]
MNTPFFGCCGWAASSIVPTKRYKTYTAAIFEDFSQLSGFSKIDRESVESLLRDENWPLTLKHASLVKKTVEYVKFNHDKLPKLGRKLRARALKGLHKKDTKYTSVAVVLMKKVVEETNSAVQMNYYIEYFLEVIAQLLVSHSNVFHYQAVSLLNLILRQPLFVENNSGVIHFQKVLGFCGAIKALEIDYHILGQIGGDSASKDCSALVISNCFLCFGYLLKLANKFKLNLPEEDVLLDFCSDLVLSKIMADDAGKELIRSLEDFENRQSLPRSYPMLSESLLSLFSEVNSAKTLSGLLLDKLLKKGAFCSGELLQSILLGLEKEIESFGGTISYLYETFMEACTALYAKDLVQACNLVTFLFSSRILGFLDVDVESKAFEQWLYLRSVEVEEEDQGGRGSTLKDLEARFARSERGERRMLRFLCVLENWAMGEDVGDESMKSTLKELEERGLALGYKECSLSVSRVALKDPTDYKDPNICPYESQIMLEEMLLALGSGTI